MRARDFQQVDVFSATACKGNPVAVVLDGEGLSDAAMLDFACWTNLSETTFLLPPTEPSADYRVRIFTPSHELPFAGHPTLGSCHAWLKAGGVPKGETVVQQCEAGLIKIRRGAGPLAFAAPPLVRDGPVSDEDMARIISGIGVAPEAILRAQWLDNGANWVGVMIGSREAVLSIKPDYDALGTLELGVVAPGETGDETQFELRAFMPSQRAEDPVTGSLNAGVAQWLIGAGLAPDSYIAAQGTALGRVGRIHVAKEGDVIWIGGETNTLVAGQAMI